MIAWISGSERAQKKELQFAGRVLSVESEDLSRVLRVQRVLANQSLFSFIIKTDQEGIEIKNKNNFFEAKCKEKSEKPNIFPFKSLTSRLFPVRTLPSAPLASSQSQEMTLKVFTNSENTW